MWKKGDRIYKNEGVCIGDKWYSTPTPEQMRAAVGDEDRQAHMTITSDSISIHAFDPTNDIDASFIPGEANITGNSGGEGLRFNVNSRPVVTQLVISESLETAPYIGVLSGGTSFVYTEPLTELTVESVVNTTVEDRLQFTLASGGSVGIPASCGLCPSGFVFEGGKSYLVAVMGGNVVATEYQPGV